jgi:hypothetical protein
MQRMAGWMRVLALLGWAGGAAAAPGFGLAGGSIGFSEQDAKGQPVRRIAVALTDEPAESCLGGEWKKVRVIADDANGTAKPVYREDNGKLEVLLVNTMCDAYDSYIGTLRGGRFSGEHVQYGWGSKTVGQVSGVFIAKQ